jgi:nucleoid DNA-binding protein
MSKKPKRSKNGSTELLFAWAWPAYVNESPLDHTWITTFDLNGRPDKVERSRRNGLYWYCYGDLRLKGQKLAFKAGSASIASCLVQPNIRSQESRAARGTIFKYGWHGVCHQVANQVLFSTATKGPAITVKKARGYWSSTSIYGTYGRNIEDWEERKRRCSVRIKGSESNDTQMGTDEFEKHASEVLENHPDLLRRLLTLRQDIFKADVPDNASAAEINAMNQAWFDKAAHLLGPSRFKAVFEHEASERINLVDPRFMHSESSQAQQVAAPTANVHPLATVTLKHLAAALAETHDMSKKQAETVLGDLVGNIVKHLKKGERIRIGGLGILQVRKRAARIGRNPATGEQMKIKASKKVAFRASKELVDVLAPASSHRSEKHRRMSR